MTQDLGKQEIIRHVGVAGGVGREIRTAASSISPIHTRPRAVCLCCWATCAAAPQPAVPRPAGQPLSRPLRLRAWQEGICPGTSGCPAPAAAHHGLQHPGPAAARPALTLHAPGSAGCTRSTWETRLSGGHRSLPSGLTELILRKGSTKFWRVRGKKPKRYRRSRAAPGVCTQSSGCNPGRQIIKGVNQGQTWKLLPQPSARATHFSHVTVASSAEPELQSAFDWQMLQHGLRVLFSCRPHTGHQPGKFLIALRNQIP